MGRQWNYKGIIPALALPLKADYSVDEADLRRISDGWRAWAAEPDELACHA